MKPIVITPGEPSGIGPDVLLKAAHRLSSIELRAICDENLLIARAKMLGVSIPHNLKIHHVPLKVPNEIGKPNSANAHYVLETLKIAASACAQKECRAMVTGPVNKSVMQDARISFLGHTEWLAHYFKVKQTVMLFVCDKFKVALYTTHLPLAKVPRALKRNSLHRCVTILNRYLMDYFQIARPRILVCGLNPHAGEQGHLGKEERKIIEPVLGELKKGGLNVVGPIPADTAFTPENRSDFDAILAMYHDQALPVVKALCFNNAVNVTLGLPIIRTSVDHGTAFSLAGTGKADEGSLVAAIELACSLGELCEPRNH